MPFAKVSSLRRQISDDTAKAIRSYGFDAGRRRLNHKETVLLGGHAFSLDMRVMRFPVNLVFYIYDYSGQGHSFMSAALTSDSALELHNS